MGPGKGWRFRDLRGQRFGRLVVLDDEPQRRDLPSGRKIVWHCRCDCGTETWVQRGSLTGGLIYSCGCARNELARARCTTHGLSNRPEYRVWANMCARCYQRSSSYYYCYGARGITVCERWRTSFANFFADMGERPSPKHTIERLDNNGNYEPGNCVWADAMTQGSNTRTNRRITCDGRTQTLAQWSRETGIPAPTLHRRLKEGWDPEIALGTPPLLYWDRRPKRTTNH